MVARYRPPASLGGNDEWLARQRRQQSATGLLVPGPGGTWITTSQDAQTRATAAQAAAASYTNDTINAQNLPQMRAEIASAGTRLSGAESSILTLGGQMADAGSRLGGVEGSVGTLFGHTGALRVDVDYVAGRATTGINNAASAQSTANGAQSAASTAQSAATSAATAASNALTRAQQAYDYAESVASALPGLSSALNATRAYIKSQHPGAPWSA